MGGAATGLAARMLEQLGRAVVGADTEFRVVYWNRAAGDMFGWSPYEVLDRNILEATGTELDPDRGLELLEQLKAGAAFSEEVWMGARDGRRFPVLASVTPMMDGDRMDGIVAVLIDITDRLKIERAAEEGRQRLRRSPAGGESRKLRARSGLRGRGLDWPVSPHPRGRSRADAELEPLHVARASRDREAFEERLAEFVRGDLAELDRSMADRPAGRSDPLARDESEMDHRR